MVDFVTVAKPVERMFLRPACRSRPDCFGRRWLEREMSSYRVGTGKLIQVNYSKETHY
jgi:hypothetical protein